EKVLSPEKITEINAANYIYLESEAEAPKNFPADLLLLDPCNWKNNILSLSEALKHKKFERWLGVDGNGRDHHLILLVADGSQMYKMTIKGHVEVNNDVYCKLDIKNVLTDMYLINSMAVNTCMEILKSIELPHQMLVWQGNTNTGTSYRIDLPRFNLSFVC